MEKREVKGDDPRVTLTFRRPEHEQELREALNGGRYKAVLFELDNWLRSVVKHGEDETKATHYQAVRDELHVMMEGQGVSLYDE